MPVAEDSVAEKAVTEGPVEEDSESNVARAGSAAARAENYHDSKAARGLQAGSEGVHPAAADSVLASGEVCLQNGCRLESSEHGRRGELSDKRTRLLQDLRAALSGPIERSAGARSVLEEIEAAGLSVFLVIDDSESDREPEAMRLILTSTEKGETLPDFRIDQSDLSLLRDLGIDPTRTIRRGRRARRT